MSEPLVFNQSYESLVRVLGAQLTPELRKRFHAHGVDLQKLAPAYPMQTWVTSLRLAMDVLFPGRSEDDASFELGRRMFTSYGETVIGTALMGMLRVLGPRRGLLRMERNLRTTNNYSLPTLAELSPTKFELHLNLVNFPQYYRGLFVAGLQSAGTKDLRVEVLGHDVNGTTFRIEWT